MKSDKKPTSETQIKAQKEEKKIIVHSPRGKLEPQQLGLNRTGHMSVQPGQDRTPKFAGSVLPDRTKSGHMVFS